MTTTDKLRATDTTFLCCYECVKATNQVFGKQIGGSLPGEPEDGGCEVCGKRECYLFEFRSELTAKQICEELSRCK